MTAPKAERPTTENAETETAETETAVSVSGVKMNGAQMARLIGVDGKAFRDFLRKAAAARGQSDGLPGSGGQYSLTADQAPKWAAAFAAHSRSKGKAEINADDWFTFADPSDEGAA
jgi:hypothetical protein